MWEKLKELVRNWLGVKAEQDERLSPDDFVRAYEKMNTENIVSVIAWKLATLCFGDSTIEVKEAEAETASMRTEYIKGILDEFWSDQITGVVAQAFGKGGKLLMPVCDGKNVHIHAIDQSRMVVRESRGDVITACTICVDMKETDEHKYYLVADYSLEGDVQVIRYRCVRGKSFVSMAEVDEWADIEPEQRIAGVDRLLFAFIRCPKDNRSDNEVCHGVPITFGAESLIAELEEHGRIYRREYKLTRPMLGLDSTLFRRFDGSPMPTNIDMIRKTVQDGDDPFVPFESSSLDGKSMWQYYAPAIRNAAMEERYESLCRRIEKACGLSQGILTERKSMNYANRDEVRAAQYDTFSVVKAMRQHIEHALDDLAYAIDVLCEHYSLTPAGSRDSYVIACDWDMSLIESTEQTYQQMTELQQGGMVSKAELRAWVMGGTVEEAQEAIDGINEAGGEPNVFDSLLAGMNAREAGMGGDE